MSSTQAVDHSFVAVLAISGIETVHMSLAQAKTLGSGWPANLGMLKIVHEFQFFAFLGAHSQEYLHSCNPFEIWGLQYASYP